MELLFAPAEAQDAAAIMAIINEAKEFMRLQGLPQWQGGYPNMQSVVEDISLKQAYLLRAGGKPAGTLALCFGEEPAYNNIYSGSWLTKGGYAAIHRVAVGGAYRGSQIAGPMLAAAEGIAKTAGAGSIRIDTHESNLPMQRFLQKNGYLRCGDIYLSGGPEDGEKRIAFEKIL